MALAQSICAGQLRSVLHLLVRCFLCQTVLLLALELARTHSNVVCFLHNKTTSEQVNSLQQQQQRWLRCRKAKVATLHRFTGVSKTMDSNNVKSISKYRLRAKTSSSKRLVAPRLSKSTSANDSGQEFFVRKCFSLCFYACGLQVMESTRC